MQHDIADEHLVRREAEHALLVDVHDGELLDGALVDLLEVVGFALACSLQPLLVLEEGMGM